MKISSKLRNSFVVWISIYPAITIILLLIGDGMNSLPIYVKTFILTLILVPLMVYILIPFWTNILNALGKRINRSGEIVDKR